MKKNLFIVIAAMLVIFAACKKDDDGGVVTPGANDPAYTAPYSTKPVSEQKDDVSDASMELADEIETISNLDALAVIMNLAGKIDDGGMLEPVTQAIQVPVKAAQALQEKSSPSEITDILKAPGDDYSIQDMFDDIAGEYDWDSLTYEFVQTSAGGDAIILNFPGMEDDVTNNATLTIDNVTIMEITDPLEDWPEDMPTEMPTSISVSLEYENVEIMSLEFTATYNEQGIPTSLSAVLTIEEYSFSTVITHLPLNQKASYKETFKHLNEILVESYVEVNGNWTEDNINANLQFETVCDEYYPDDCWEELTEESFENIINNGNAYLQVMDLKIVGYVNVLVLKPIMEDLDDQCWEQEIITEQQWATQSAAQINANVNLVLVYTTGEKIAEVEAYPLYSDEWEEWDISVRLRFADGSVVDGETFAEEELEDFMIAMDELFDLDEEIYY